MASKDFTSKLDKNLGNLRDDKNGTMNAKEFKQVLVSLGKRDINEEQAKKMLSDHDLSHDGVIQWNEFLEVSYKGVNVYRCSRS